MAKLENPTRKLSGFYGTVVLIIALTWGILQLIFLTVYAIDPWLLRALHLSFAGVIGVMLYRFSESSPDTKASMMDLVLALLFLGSFGYILLNMTEMLNRYGVVPTTGDVVFGLITLILLLELVRRTSGLALPVICLAFIAYALFGDYLPGFLWNRGYSIERLTSFLYSLDGIYSTPLGVSATYVIMFVIFGNFLQQSGGGKFIIDFSYAIAGATRGGPAKVAVLASSLLGTISGSAVANVATVGTLTIPLMKRVGYKPQFAAAVEAVASSGGQIMPPIMGAAAFIMADILGISYGNIVSAAIIPALLYYIAIFWIVDLEAVKLKLFGIPRNELDNPWQVLKNGWIFVIPIIVIVYVLIVMNASPIKAALYGIVATVICSWFRKDTKMGLREITQAIAGGAIGTVSIAATCAAAGIIVGVLSLTGLGVALANLIISLAGSNILLALLFTMILCIILGMGMPTVAAYVITAATVAPALIKLGLDPLPAHMFIFYFSSFSTLTPPVALAAYAAAGIANSNPMQTGFTAVKLSLIAFIIPYMFVYGTSLLMIGTLWQICWSLVTGIIGTLALGAGLQGYLFGNANVIQRVLFLGGALTLIDTSFITDVIGFILVGIAAFWNWVLKRGSSNESFMNNF